MWTGLSYYVCFGLLFIASYSRLIGSQNSAQPGKFTLDATSYDCSGTLICLGDAHKYDGESDGTLISGSLSLIREAGENAYGKSGIAYYNKPVRMRDVSSRQSASFNTSFSFSQVPGLWNRTGNYYLAGDGITFVISADNQTIGSPGEFLGFFGLNGSNSFKSVVVEFDNYFNRGPPEFDIGWNHVSLDLANITYVAAKNASDVNVYFWGESSTVFAWVDYSAATKRLEVRVSNTPSRPIDQLLTYTVDLFDEVEEYMWVGFSGGTGSARSYYYIGEWTFESYGIPPAPALAPSPAPTLAPAPALNNSLAPASTPSPPAEPRSKMATIVAISVGTPAACLLVIVGIIIIYLCLVRRRDSGSGICARRWFWFSLHKEDPALQLAGISRGYRFSYNQLSVATGGFSEESKLGQGGFGSVYRGVLPSSRGAVPVAVKKINRESKQGEKEFMAEVSIIGQLRHRNLIQLLGWCDEGGNYLIVYELMPNGSLDKVLFRVDEKHTGLSWPQRFNVVTGTAAAMDYLHQGWKQQVIHRDIKASNIMLDDDWNAKLGDFGLARVVDHERSSATTLVAGTLGYIAPEAAASGRFTDKTDVFAFGAVALEVACGRKAVALHLPPDEIILVDWVWQRLSEGDLMSVVDSRLLSEYDSHWMEVVLLMGLHCSHPNPHARPAMRHVVQVLAGDVEVPSIPTSKPAPVFGKESQSVSIKGLQSPQSIAGPVSISGTS